MPKPRVQAADKWRARLLAKAKRKPRPMQQLELEMLLGQAQKVATLLLKARTTHGGPDRAKWWGVFFDVQDEYRFRKNAYMTLYVPGHTPERVKYPDRYLTTEERESQMGSNYVSPNEEEYGNDE
jgi:hypothetical protein